MSSPYGGPPYGPPYASIPNTNPSRAPIGSGMPSPYRVRKIIGALLY